MSVPLPVTVITGALGAGKTTLVNRLLKADRGERIAVLVNEFGEAGIDGELIEGAQEELIEFANGCVCCTIRGDLVRTLRTLLKDPRKFDRMVIETSGLAVPGPVVQTFLVDQTLAAQTMIDGVVAVVDARHIAGQLADSPEAAEQIAFADRIILNKAELAGSDELTAIEGRLRQLNAIAPIHRTCRAEVATDALFGSGGFDLQRLELAGVGPSAPAGDTPAHVHDRQCGHAHGYGIASVSLFCEQPMDGRRIADWLQQLVATQGADILRGKGIIAIAGEDRRFVFHSVHMLIEGDLQRPWRADEPRTSRLVLIGRDLDESRLRDGFEGCVRV